MAEDVIEEVFFFSFSNHRAQVLSFVSSGIHSGSLFAPEQITIAVSLGVCWVLHVKQDKFEGGDKENATRTT